MPAYFETANTAALIDTTPHDFVPESAAHYASAPQDSAADLIVGADCRLDCEELEHVARMSAPRIRLSARSQAAMDASRGILLRRQAAGDAIYGVTTGFGPFVRYNSAANGQAAHGEGLIAHLGAGWGPSAPADVVRASMLLRVHTLAQGWSGVRPNVVEGYIEMLANGIVPSVPIIGSVGASGDLIPLAHIARALCGQGDVLCTADMTDAADGTGSAAAAARTETYADATTGTISAAHALNAAGMTPLELDGRDALALTNGTAFLTAYASLAVARAERLIARAEALTGWLYRALGCRASALDPRLHHARGHAGQRQSAAAIRAEAGRYGMWENTTRPLQEIYSLRCAPQVLGACRENLAFARRLIETELNGISDNPLCGRSVERQASSVEREGMGPESGRVDLLEMGDEAAGGDALEGAVLEEAMLHGGNFHGQQVAFAADALNAALTQVGLLVDRQLDALLDPHINGGAPLLLAWEPGATSGMAGAQITATALAAEMRTHTQSYATSSIPTNGGNQDIVSMGTLAARMACEQTERLAPLLAILGMALVQLGFLRERERAPKAVTSTPAWMPPFAPFEKDRALRHDITRIAQAWLLPATETHP